MGTINDKGVSNMNVEINKYLDSIRADFYNWKCRSKRAGNLSRCSHKIPFTPLSLILTMTLSSNAVTF